MPAEVSELSTRPTPSPGAYHEPWPRSAYCVDLELTTCSTPIERSKWRLRLLPAVAHMSPPRFLTTWQAARPMPPAAACTSTRCWGKEGKQAAWRMAASTVTNTVTIVQASTKLALSGIGTTSC